MANVPAVSMDDFTPPQLMAAEMLCDLDSDLTAKQIAAECGIAEGTMSRWRNDPRFMALVEHIAETNMRFSLVNVYKQLHRTARAGNTRSMEMLLKQQGKLIDRREVTQETTVNVTSDKTATQLSAEIAELERRLLEQSAHAIELTSDTDGTFSHVE